MYAKTVPYRKTNTILVSMMLTIETLPLGLVILNTVTFFLKSKGTIFNVAYSDSTSEIRKDSKLMTRDKSEQR
jgi:hypothetical protein